MVCLAMFIFFNLAVDCTWNQWSEWTKCEEKCPVTTEDGKVHRYRNKNEHKCGGAPCQGDPQETKTCHIVNIMKDELESIVNLPKPCKLFASPCNLISRPPYETYAANLPDPSLSISSPSIRYIFPCITYSKLSALVELCSSGFHSPNEKLVFI